MNTGHESGEGRKPSVPQPELLPGERIDAEAQASGAIVLITSERVIVGGWSKVLLALPFSAIRRVELNMEVGQLATLTIVPDSPNHPPQIMTVEVEDYLGAGAVIAALGERLSTAHPRGPGLPPR